MYKDGDMLIGSDMHALLEKAQIVIKGPDAYTECH